jgi:hypothetical protein
MHPGWVMTFHVLYVHTMLFVGCVTGIQVTLSHTISVTCDTVPVTGMVYAGTDLTPAVLLQCGTL